MKSIFTISFLVTILFSAGTAFSYNCDAPAPPQVQPCTCSLCQKQYQKPQCNLHQPCASRCDKCAAQKKTCKKKVVHKDRYQCKTTCSTKTEHKHITTVQCKLCGAHHPKGVDHYCNKVQCKSCGQIHRRDVEHRCGTVQCRTCGVHHPQGMKHYCGKIRCQSCGTHYHQSVGHHCRSHSPHQDCSQGDCFQKNACRHEGQQGKHRQCATRDCNATHKESKETMETRWHNWFNNQG